MPGAVDRLDDVQSRRVAIGFPVAVVYKFFDDQGNYLAAVITYYAFVAIFPLLLIASSVLGFLLQGDPQLEREVLDSTLAQFPIVGPELGRPEGMQGSASSVVAGTLVSLYGVTNLGQAAQNTLNVIWGVPRNSRLNPVHGRLRSLLLLVVGGVAVLVVALLPTLVNRVVGLTVGEDPAVGLLVELTVVGLSALVLSLMMMIAASNRPRLLAVLPGAVVIAVLWQVLQAVGGLYVERVVTRTSDLNGTFALVLGLILLIYLASTAAIIGLEVNVVHAKRLYPRALRTPFTDDVELTEADRRVYTQYAQAQRHKGFQRISVSFDREPRAGGDDGGSGADSSRDEPLRESDSADDMFG